MHLCALVAFASQGSRVRCRHTGMAVVHKNTRVIAKSTATGAYGNANKKAKQPPRPFAMFASHNFKGEGPTSRAERVQIMRDAGARWTRFPKCEKAKWRTKYSASCASVGGCGVSQPSHPRQEPRHEQTAVACPSAELGAQSSIAHLSCSECLVHSTSAHKWTRGVSGVPCSRQAAAKGCSLKVIRML